MCNGDNQQTLLCNKMYWRSLHNNNNSKNNVSKQQNINGIIYSWYFIALH